MGQNSILTRQQSKVFDELAKSKFLKSTFYFSGGTALSEVYLRHRESVDLDFFSPGEFDKQVLLNIVTKIAGSLGASLGSYKIEDIVNVYIFDFGGEDKLKVDFSFYPYIRLAEGSMYKGFQADSKFDIAVNKLLLIGSQRSEVKDFVDLYFLFEEFNTWQLIDGVRTKFNIEIEPFMLAKDFLVVSNFGHLPKMHKKLDLDTLKGFFMAQAKKLGKKSIG